MGDCNNIARCTFFDIKAKDRMQQLALKGFMKLYCMGPKQDQCLRRFVGKSLGGPDKIPCSMMPNGHPLTGSNDSDWPLDVKALLAREWDSRQRHDSAQCSPPIKKKVVS
jgi:hypothetical protein